MNKLLYGTPLGGNAATYGIQLYAVAIKPNSSREKNLGTCIQVLQLITVLILMEHMIQFNPRNQLFMDSHNNYRATQNNENKRSSVCSLRLEFSTLSQGVMGYDKYNFCFW